MDILFKNDDFVFSYRVGGILIHNAYIERVMALEKEEQENNV